MSRRSFAFPLAWLWHWVALFWCLLASPLVQAAVTGTLVQQGGIATPAIGQALPAGLALLSNGGKAVAYLNQTGGDPVNGAGPFYEGKVKVLSATNNPVTTVTLTPQSSFFVSDISVTALTNGGFVVAWTELDQATASSLYNNYFARYDNAGALQGAAAAISSNKGRLARATGLSGGGFVLSVVEPTDQSLYLKAYSYSGGTFTPNTEVKWGSISTLAPNPSNDPDVGYLRVDVAISVAPLSDGNFIVATPVYDYVSSNYTPLGVFALKFSSTGQPVNFAGGSINYRRVNWDGQSRLALAQAFSGGFAVMSMSGSDPNRKWEMTVFQNDGTLVTTNAQTASVYNNGATQNRTYHANQFATLTSTASTRYNWGNYYGAYSPATLAATALQAGQVVALLPNEANEFSLYKLDPATGLTVGSFTDLGITVPTPVNANAVAATPGLLQPFYLPDGGSGSYALLYASGGSQSGPDFYTRTDVYQIGLDAIIPSSDATLSALSLSAGTLTPGFAGGTTSYTASVGYGATSVSVTPTVNESHATVTVNGSNVSSGAASGAIALNVGSNTITVAVTAQDGTTVGTYTVTVTRGAPSSNADLAGLALSSGTLSPAFASGTTAYTASVSNATISMTVTPTVADATASVKVNGTTVASGSASGGISLNVGSNTITVAVTAQDGTTVATYTVTVARAGSSNADLSALALSTGALAPAFASGTTAYTASVSNATAAISVTPTLADATASAKVNGTTVASGAASGSIALNVGSNTITVVVTAQDGITVKTYTVTVTRAGSSNANLSALALSAGTLAPAFASGTTAYTASVPNATASMTVTPTVADATASVKVNGTTVASGSASGGISLNVGSNTITVAVTAQDGTTIKTYAVTVTRAGSSNADLSALVLSSGALTPAFASGTTNYTASVSNAVSALTVTPTVADATASLKVNGTTVASGAASGSISLIVGSNTITVVVTAQDGTTVNTYTVAVTRADVAGLCGSAQGAATAFLPSANLCSAGASSAVSRTGNNWSWSCTGGASTASCTAPLQGTATNAGAGSATVVPNGNNWVVDTANSAGFIPVTGHPKSPAVAPPAGYRFPYGLFDVKLVTGTPNTQASVVITYPQNLSPRAVYWKYGPRVLNGPSEWYVFSGAVISGNTVTLTLTDQGAGDSDLNTPSSIIDPGGVGDPVDPSQIPTLSEWALAIMSVLLTLGGALALRRTRQYRRSL